MCLRRFDEVGRYAQSGKWQIGRGGYDLNWELYYERLPVVDCVDHYVEVVNDYGMDNAKQVVKIIMREYGYIRGVNSIED